MGLAAGVAAAAGIGAVGSVAGGLIGAGAAKSAANTQAAAQDRATQATQQEIAQTRQDLQPFTQAGASALPFMEMAATGGQVGSQPNYLAMAGANLPGTMTQAQLEATPGYQFTLGQGLKAVQNSAAARGLGVSGAAMKGAAAYATGLADSTYKDQFAIQQQRYADMFGLGQTQYANLSDLAKMGASSAGMTGQIGSNLTGTTNAALLGSASSQAGNILSGGQAGAAGLTGAGNAVTGGVNSYLGYNLLQQAIQNNQTRGWDTGSGAANLSSVDPATLQQIGLG